MLDVARPKPHPDVVLECLARLGVPPAAGVYVGDAESDLAPRGPPARGSSRVGDGTWSPHAVRDLRELPAVLDALALG